MSKGLLGETNFSCLEILFKQVRMSRAVITSETWRQAVQEKNPATLGVVFFITLLI